MYTVWKDSRAYSMSAFGVCVCVHGHLRAGCAEEFRAESGPARRPTVEAARQMSWQVVAEVPAESVAEVWFSSVC